MPFRLTEGFRQKGAFRQANARCKHCGAIAHIRLIAEGVQPVPIATAEYRKCRIPLV
jgi:hypothetical protein